MVLQLDVQATRLDERAQPLQLRAPFLLALLEDPLRDHASHAPGEHDEALSVLADDLEINARREPALRAHVPRGDDADQVPVTLGGLGEQDQVVNRSLFLRARAPAPHDVHLAAEDRAHASGLAGFVVLDRAEHVAMVGEGDRAHAERLGPGREVLDPQGAVEQRIL